MIGELNINELITGAAVGALFAFLVGWWALLLVPVTGLLWALGGRYGHAWRVFGVPVLPVLLCIILKHHIWALLSYLLSAIILSIGYGIPDKPMVPDGDKGSPLGRFWVKVFSKKYGAFEDTLYSVANLCTRATIFILLALAFIPCFF
jgi:hypothetical protein